MPNVEAKTLLASALNFEANEIPDDASIETFEPWDSLVHMQLIEVIEQQMGRPLETEEILSIMDLASIQEIFAVR